MPGARPATVGRLGAVGAPRDAVLEPASTRLLAALPGPRSALIVLWALVPWLNAGANALLGTTTRIWEDSRALALVNCGALSLAIVVALWGSQRITERIRALRTTARAGLAGYSEGHFRELNSMAGPLVASLLTAAVFAASAFVRDGWASALLRGGTWLLLGIALWSFLWTYGALHLGLNRLAREPLRADAARLDPALGLRPVGDVSFTGLWMLLAWLVPVLLTGLPDIVGVAVGLAVLAAGLATFFVSLLVFHRRMVELKAGELALARRLYAEAYDPVRASPTLETLEQQHVLLASAEALVQRARAIADWPIGEGTVARVITIVTSVLAMAVGRLILDPIGL